MRNSVVIQSHTQPLPAAWFKSCLHSVETWAEQNNYDYVFIDDALFDRVPKQLLAKTSHQRVIATDLARLMLLQEYLQHGYQTVIWCDADVLVFAPRQLVLPQESYCLGREVWIQQDDSGKLSAHVKVHNAFMMYRRGNSFLDFYTETARRLLTLNTGAMPPQFIGPKLLSAIHNIAQCPVLETAGMLSPCVIDGLLQHSSAAVDLFRRRSPAPIAAANLCGSLHANKTVSTMQIETCIQHLAQTQVV